MEISFWCLEYERDGNLRLGHRLPDSLHLTQHHIYFCLDQGRTCMIAP